MLYALVGDAPDGFMLVGDGQQSIYPGGYTLSEAGLSVANRGVMLDVNYRNTSEILEFAHRVIAGSEYADIEGEIARGERPKEVPRTGPMPVVDECLTRAEHDRKLVERVRLVVREIGTGYGDVGILTANKYSVTQAERALQAAGIPAINLEKYDGGVADAVKVGTIKRAKGLEFKQVLVASVPGSQLGGEPADRADEVAMERWDLDRRELYVALTRARDGLWVGVVPG